MTRESDKSKPLWAGRFSEEPDPVIERYSSSLHLDRRLALYDLKGTVAHVRMLAAQAIISSQEEQAILDAVAQVEREVLEQTFPYRPELDDIHMNIEHRLHELAGDAGRKVHTGRSRNDQVLVDMKLYSLDTAQQWSRGLLKILGRLTQRAGALTEVLLPAWTHLQSAQVITWAHYLLAFSEMFLRDFERLRGYRRLHSVSPLGAGALAGSSLPLDPALTAAALGFDESFGNSYDVVGDRDFILELLQIASQLMVHASRLAEDFVYFASTPVGWIDLPDSLCTGSSMMPQKKNPDLLELVRGKTASVLGHTQALTTLLKGLPTSYHRDLQQDKEHLFGAADLVATTLEVLPLILDRFEVNADRCRSPIDAGFMLATELAEHLVQRGVPFRTAHEKVGRLVGSCVKNRQKLSELTLDELRAWIPEAGEEALQTLNPASAIARRHYPGSAGTIPTRKRLAFWEEWLARQS